MLFRKTAIRNIKLMTSSCALIAASAVSANVQMSDLPENEVLTYSEKNLGYGEVVTIQGNRFALVGIPVLGRVDNKRYAVSFLAADDYTGGFDFETEIRSGKSDCLTGNEINVNGHVVKYHYKRDWRPKFSTHSFDPINRLNLNPTYSLEICINLGGTYLTLPDLSRYIPLSSITADEDDFNLSDNIDWAVYREKSEEMTRFFDDIIDYIKIETLE